MSFSPRILAAVLLAASILPALAQTTNATPVPAGSTATIAPAKGTTPGTPDTPQGKILKSALTPETRKTLQAAMDATPNPK